MQDLGLFRLSANLFFHLYAGLEWEKGLEKYMAFPLSLFLPASPGPVTQRPCGLPF
jgi:hypothetical protein